MISTIARVTLFDISLVQILRVRPELLKHEISNGVRLTIENH